VRMHEILAEDMVGERVALFLVVIVGHSRRAPCNMRVGRRDGGYRMLPMRSQESSKPGVVLPANPKGGARGEQAKFVAPLCIKPEHAPERAHQRSRSGHAFGFVDSARTPRHLAPLVLWLVAFSPENRYPRLRKMLRSPTEWM
jgi:hypothetical protein